MAEPDPFAGKPPPPGAYETKPAAGRSPIPASSQGPTSPPPSGPRMPWHDRGAEPPHQPPWQLASPESTQAGPPSPFRGRVVLLGILLAITTVLIIQSVALGIIGTSATERTEAFAALIATFIADAVGLVAVPYFLLGGSLRGGKRRAWALLGLHRPGLKTLAWAFAGLGLGYLGLGIYLGLVDLIGIDALQPVSTIDDDVIYDHVELVVMVSLLAIVIAPITEEIFYRGFLFGGLATVFGTKGTMRGVVVGGLLSGLIFALAHFDVGSIIPFTIIGVVFAFVYHRSQSLFAAVGAHVMFNAIAIAGTLADRGVG
jgi:membrane protease YdiL (CAAX protease family)